MQLRLERSCQELAERVEKVVGPFGGPFWILASLLPNPWAREYTEKVPGSQNTRRRREKASNQAPITDTNNTLCNMGGRRHQSTAHCGKLIDTVAFYIL